MLLAVVFCLLASASALSSPASVGLDFADSYSAFAPLYTLYKSYANFLFAGTQIVIPPDLGGACSQFRDDLSALQVEIITQTDSQRIEQVTRIAHLRQTTGTFCQRYHDTISVIASLAVADLDTFKQAADGGLFAAISDENKELEGLFSSMLDTYTGSEQWKFAVAFSMRTVLKQRDLVKLDSNLREILLGPKDHPYEAGIVPPAILSQARELAALAGISLDDTERQRAISLTREIYDYLMKLH